MLLHTSQCKTYINDAIKNMKQYNNSANFVHYDRLSEAPEGGGWLHCWLGSTRVNGADAKVQQCQPAFRPTGSSIQLSLLSYYWTWRQKKRTDTVKPTLTNGRICRSSAYLRSSDERATAHRTQPPLAVWILIDDPFWGFVNLNVKWWHWGPLIFPLVMNQG